MFIIILFVGGCIGTAIPTDIPVLTPAADEQPLRSASSTERLRVATYNIHYGRGEDDVLDLGRIADVVRHVDIALLNEVDAYWPRSDYTEQARVIATLAGFNYYAFAPSLTVPQIGRPAALYGNAVLSRYPIQSVTRHPLSRPPGKEPRSAFVARVDVDGTLLNLLGTHLGLNAKERLNQTEDILNVLSSLSGPTIVAGDFNALPDAPEIRRLSSAFYDTHTLFLRDDEGFTFPNPRPTARIDYVFVSHDLVPHVLSHKVPVVSGSDHLPVVLSVDWAGYIDKEDSSLSKPMAL